MTIVDFTDGDALSAANLDGMFAEVWRMVGINVIRQLQDRAVDFSSGEFDGWGEAYVDSDGQGDSVSSATAWYDAADEFYAAQGSDEASGDTTHDPDSWTNPGNAFDGDDSTYARITPAGGATKYLGKTFSSKTVGYVRVKAKIGATASTTVFILQTYDGSSWSTDTTLYNGSPTTIDKTVLVNSSVQGLRVGITPTNSENADLYTLEYSTGATVTVTHSIPSGTFSSTVSRALGTVLFDGWEDGVDVNYKLTNAGDDSGWLNINEVSSFTAFTSEPTTLTLQLVPKSGGTAGYPVVKGVWVRAS